MNTRSIRTARCGLPIAREDRQDGHLLPSEESATLLLWAFPRLLGCAKTINWLFSPVTGKTRYPGDLWGVDSEGELLVVETKLTRTGRPQNPFEDFVDYAAKSEATKLWTAEHLEQRWRGLFKKEQEFQRQYPKLFRAPLTDTLPGVLPYSRQRDAVGRWQALYRDRIAPAFLDNSYRRAVERSLRARQRRGNPPPVFAGLLATVREDEPNLSVAGATAMRRLAKRVGLSRVHLQGMRVEPEGAKQLLVQSWTMHPQ